MKQLIEETPETLALADDDRLPPMPEDHEPPEVRAAKDLARRYRLPYIDLLPHEGESPIDYNLFTEVPVDLMVRHQFVPLRRDARGLHIAMADPTDLERLDELASALQIFTSKRVTPRYRSSTASTAPCMQRLTLSTLPIIRRSFLVSRLCLNSTSPSGACPRTEGSEFATKGATSTSAFRSCPPFTARTQLSVSWIKNRSTKNSRT